MINVDFTTMLLAAAVVGGVVYMQIQKVTNRLDEAEQNPDVSIYDGFCTAIEDSLVELKNRIDEDIYLKNPREMDKFLHEISMLNKELVFIQTMHSTNKNPKIWEEKLYNFLSKIEIMVDRYLQDSDEINSEMRLTLQNQFQKLA